MQMVDAIKAILPKDFKVDSSAIGSAFAPANIALCKYWGKRDELLNLPFTDSLSVSLGDKGSQTIISFVDRASDLIELNNHSVKRDSIFAKRIISFLDLIRPNVNIHFKVQTYSNIPISAGLASSASGFAALVMACDHLFGWSLSEKKLSILARLCSGSASRSIWKNAFVKWHAGKDKMGNDSFAEPLKTAWNALRIGILLVSEKNKAISSREAMACTVKTSPDYAAWVARVPRDMAALEESIAQKDFVRMGEIAESNAIAMHQTMLSAMPAINYSLPETSVLRQKVLALREQGLPVYFTQDAGPNLKLLFLSNIEEQIKSHFPGVEIILPFDRHEPSFDVLEEVILVDEKDRQIGVLEKQLAHEKGLRHRAFSVFVVRDGDEGVEVLLQKRHEEKYHCGGLWSNSCCSHPRLGETLESAAKRRLFDEMGIESFDLQEIGIFHYIATFENGLTENEIDHVFLCYSNGQACCVNTQEVSVHQWIPIKQLERELSEHPTNYTPWLKPALEILINKMGGRCASD